MGPEDLPKLSTTFNNIIRRLPFVGTNDVPLNPKCNDREGVWSVWSVTETRCSKREDLKITFTDEITLRQCS